MRPLERVLVGFDSWPWSAIFRVVIGLCSPPVSRALFGGGESVWQFPTLFICLLIALRVAPAVMRFALPFSAKAKEIWAGRRALAKRYDSYQWQKLFWIGLGLLPHVVTAGAAAPGEILVTVVCLIGGSVGLFIWSKVGGVRAPLQT